MCPPSGACGGGSPLRSSPAGESLPGRGALLLGTPPACPFYRAPRQYEAWHPGQLILDVEPGIPEGFSLAPDDGTHFITRTAEACKQ